MGQVKKLWMDAMEHGNWPPDNLHGKCVCTNHFDDRFLNQMINDKGTPGTCSYCGHKGITRDMYDLGQDIAWKIALYFADPSEANLKYADDFYDDADEEIPGFQRVGEFIAPIENTVYDSTYELLQELNLITGEDELNADIESIFTTDTWISKDIYEEDKSYKLSNQWERFVSSVTHQRRFTFLATPEFLKAVTDDGSDDILSNLHDIIVEQKLCKDIPEGTLLYRARKVNAPDDHYEFKDITSPPDDKAFPNRMSPAGISMFYASFDKDTAMNECVGGDSPAIIVGEFETTKPLRVIDLSDIPENSFWMHNWQENRFLHKFNREITKRVDPDDKNHLQYVPTQVFTEYLRYMFKDEVGKSIDGLIYGSSKTKDKNIVLFCNQRESQKYVSKDVTIEVYVSKSVWEKK